MFIAIYIVAGIFSLIILMVFLMFFGLWFRALLSGASVRMNRIIGMWIRKVSAKQIVDSRIMLVKGGLITDSDLLETHYLAGGDVMRVSKALIAANKAELDLSFSKAAAIDLAGRDVLEAVKTCVELNRCSSGGKVPLPNIL